MQGGHQGWAGGKHACTPPSEQLKVHASTTPRHPCRQPQTQTNSTCLGINIKPDGLLIRRGPRRRAAWHNRHPRQRPAWRIGAAGGRGCWAAETAAGRLSILPAPVAAPVGRRLVPGAQRRVARRIALASRRRRVAAAEPVVAAPAGRGRRPPLLIPVVALSLVRRPLLPPLAVPGLPPSALAVRLPLPASRAVVRPPQLVTLLAAAALISVLPPVRLLLIWLLPLIGLLAGGAVERLPVPLLPAAVAVALLARAAIPASRLAGIVVLRLVLRQRRGRGAACIGRRRNDRCGRRRDRVAALRVSRVAGLLPACSSAVAWGPCRLGCKAWCSVRVGGRRCWRPQRLLQLGQRSIRRRRQGRRLQLHRTWVAASSITTAVARRVGEGRRGRSQQRRRGRDGAKRRQAGIKSRGGHSRWRCREGAVARRLRLGWREPCLAARLLIAAAPIAAKPALLLLRAGEACLPLPPVRAPLAGTVGLALRAARGRAPPPCQRLPLPRPATWAAVGVGPAAAVALPAVLLR